MQEITFVTSNTNKFNSARIILEQFGITPRQDTHDITEIQHDDIVAIARDKAAKAYAIVQKPIVITDDAWEIAGLKGFPGPYMHAMNEYFTVEDWLRLTSALTDRRITLHQQLIYQDADIQQLFTVSIPGVMLDAPKGQPGGEPFAAIASLGDGLTIAEMRDGGQSAIANKQTAWHQLGPWLQARAS